MQELNKKTDNNEQGININRITKGVIENVSKFSLCLTFAVFPSIDII